MSVGPMGMAGSVPQVQQETANQTRQVQSQQKAENAAGVGETEQDEQTSDRDADGRRLWEADAGKGEAADVEESSERQSKDPSGSCGGNLDLTG